MSFYERGGQSEFWWKRVNCINFIQVGADQYLVTESGLLVCLCDFMKGEVTPNIGVCVSAV